MLSTDIFNMYLFILSLKLEELGKALPPLNHVTHRRLGIIAQIYRYLVNHSLGSINSKNMDP